MSLKIVEMVSEMDADEFENLIQVMVIVARGTRDSEPLDPAWSLTAIHLQHALDSVKTRKGN